MQLSEFINSKLHKIIIVTLYSSLLLGFFLEENSSGGAIIDYNKLSILIKTFADHPEYTLKNYFYFRVAHYPYYYIFLSWILNFFGSFFIIKFIILHISLLLPYVFFKIIKLKFENVNSFSLIILTGIFFISPYFRSSAIWAQGENIALLFFALAIYFYLKIEIISSKKIFYIFLLTLSLAVAAYIRQYYALFAIIFIIRLFKILNYKYFLFYCIINIILASPAIYSTFFGNYGYSIRFLASDLNNFTSNFILSLTIFSFYLIPLYINKTNINNFIKYFKSNKITIIIITILSITFFIIFNYENPWGGGIFYKLFKISNNLNLFFVAIFFSIILIYHFIKDDIFNNIILLLPIFLLSLIGAMFQKYFDPLSIILIFSLFSSEILKNYMLNLRSNLKFTYIFFIAFFMGSTIYYM